jgi:hypothetical protein
MVGRTGGAPRPNQVQGALVGFMPNAVRLSAADNGRTVNVRKGQDLTIALPVTGDQRWEVSSISRSLGYPTSEGFDPNHPQGPSVIFAWTTNNPFLRPDPKLKHEITLGKTDVPEGQRAKKYDETFQVNVVIA